MTVAIGDVLIGTNWLVIAQTASLCHWDSSLLFVSPGQ